MFETLESRRMMSVSTTTTQEPVAPTTTSAFDQSDLQRVSQELGLLMNAFSAAVKSLGEAAQYAGQKA